MTHTDTNIHTSTRNMNHYENTMHNAPLHTHTHHFSTYFCLYFYVADPIQHQSAAVTVDASCSVMITLVLMMTVMLFHVIND